MNNWILDSIVCEDVDLIYITFRVQRDVFNNSIHFYVKINKLICLKCLINNLHEI